MQISILPHSLPAAAFPTPCLFSSLLLPKHDVYFLQEGSDRGCLLTVVAATRLVLAESGGTRPLHDGGTQQLHTWPAHQLPPGPPAALRVLHRQGVMLGTDAVVLF